MATYLVWVFSRGEFRELLYYSGARDTLSVERAKRVALSGRIGGRNPGGRQQRLVRSTKIASTVHSSPHLVGLDSIGSGRNRHRIAVIEVLADLLDAIWTNGALVRVPSRLAGPEAAVPRQPRL